MAHASLQMYMLRGVEGRMRHCNVHVEGSGRAHVSLQCTCGGEWKGACVTAMYMLRGVKGRMRHSRTYDTGRHDAGGSAQQGTWNLGLKAGQHVGFAFY